MCDISTLCVQIMYRELMKKIDSELPDNYDELVRYFLKEEKEIKNRKKRIKYYCEWNEINKIFWWYKKFRWKQYNGFWRYENI